jgi:hypothetical protein
MPRILLPRAGKATKSNKRVREEQTEEPGPSEQPESEPEEMEAPEPEPEKGTKAKKAKRARKDKGYNKSEVFEFLAQILDDSQHLAGCRRQTQNLLDKFEKYYFTYNGVEKDIDVSFTEQDYSLITLKACGIICRIGTLNVHSHCALCIVHMQCYM